MAGCWATASWPPQLGPPGPASRVRGEPIREERGKRTATCELPPTPGHLGALARCVRAATGGVWAAAGHVQASCRTAVDAERAGAEWYVRTELPLVTPRHRLRSGCQVRLLFRLTRGGPRPTGRPLIRASPVSLPHGAPCPVTGAPPGSGARLLTFLWLAQPSGHARGVSSASPPPNILRGRAPAQPMTVVR